MRAEGRKRREESDSSTANLVDLRVLKQVEPPFEETTRRVAVDVGGFAAGPRALGFRRLGTAAG